jgi:hypothetical protein
MKYLRVGLGTEKISPTTRRFMFDIGVESTKPANTTVRNYVASAIAIICFLLAVYAIPDPVTHPQMTVSLGAVLP